MSDKSSISGKVEQKKGKSSSRDLNWIATKILNDVLTDEGSLFKPGFNMDYDAYLQRLWDSNHDIYVILSNAKDLEEARDSLYTYLDQAERKVFALDNDQHIGDGPQHSVS